MLTLEEEDDELNPDSTEVLEKMITMMIEGQPFIQYIKGQSSKVNVAYRSGNGSVGRLYWYPLENELNEQIVNEQIISNDVSSTNENETIPIPPLSNDTSTTSPSLSSSPQSLVLPSIAHT